jgi:hypothetical protein
LGWQAQITNEILKNPFLGTKNFKKEINCEIKLAYAAASVASPSAIAFSALTFDIIAHTVVPHAACFPLAMYPPFAVR